MHACTRYLANDDWRFAVVVLRRPDMTCSFPSTSWLVLGRIKVAETSPETSYNYLSPLRIEAVSLTDGDVGYNDQRRGRVEFAPDY